MLRVRNGCVLWPDFPLSVTVEGGFMSSSLAGIFDALTHKMSFLSQKQAVLAENVANADTPGYKELAVKQPSFGDTLKQASITMAVTNPRDIVPASMSGVNAQTYQVKNTEVMPNGNSVDIEGQMMEVSKTSMDYQAMTAIYHKMAGLFKIAIKGSST
ncbi:MAG: flagellar basal body rod protein FlgB [Alphaproteobacteria bacterium]|nr:flagellar basal body rod protein FlgB [Alphaproteobacteria bacterium]